MEWYQQEEKNQSMRLLDYINVLSTHLVCDLMRMRVTSSNTCMLFSIIHL